MKLINLTFKKLGNHWYLDLVHDYPNDLILDPTIEKFLSFLDKNNEGVLTNINLVEQDGFINPNGLIQFKDSDLLRYFTTNDEFVMKLYINNHKFTITSKLYFLLEQAYNLDLHEVAYSITII